MSRLVVFLGIVLGILLVFGAISCGTSSDGGARQGNYTPVAPPTPPDQPPPPSDGETTAVNLEINEITTCPPGVSCLVTPGVPPGTIKLAGTIESGQCWDVFATAPSCWVDRSGEVVGGTLNHSYTVRIGDPYHIVYSLANQRRVDSIRINGIALTSFGILGTAPYQWVVACFIPQRDQTGLITINNNPNCTAQVSQARLVYTGDTGGSGAIGSYTNSAYNMPYDDSAVPYNGAAEGTIHLQTSYWENPNPGGVWQTWVWNGAMNAYTETFFSVATTQGAYFTVYHPCRDPLAPPGCNSPGFGVYLDVMPLGGGAVQCTTQLVHYEDVDPDVTFWYGATITGINNATHCATQGADTRGIVVGGP